MRQLCLALALLFVFATTGQAANISGEYLEARTCVVYTGPCFANAEMGLTGSQLGAAASLPTFTSASLAPGQLGEPSQCGPVRRRPSRELTELLEKESRATSGERTCVGRRGSRPAPSESS